MNWFKALFFPNVIRLTHEHEIEHVFTCGGIKEYKFLNDFNIPYERAMAALDIYRELEEMTDAKYTKTAYNTIIEYLKKGDNINAGLVCHFALERMNNISNADLMYKLASVLYFDAGENPYKYDHEYAEKKIKRWKKSEKIDAFFLKTPLSALLPSFDGLQTNILIYTEAKRKELLATLKHHLSNLSGESSNPELILTLKYQIQELEELLSEI